jgi:hypothetical protein
MKTNVVNKESYYDGLNTENAAVYTDYLRQFRTHKQLFTIKFTMKEINNLPSNITFYKISVQLHFFDITRSSSGWLQKKNLGNDSVTQINK